MKAPKQLSSDAADARIRDLQDRSLVGLPHEDKVAELKRRGLSDHLIAERLDAIARLELSDGIEGDEE